MVKPMKKTAKTPQAAQAELDRLIKLTEYICHGFFIGALTIWQALRIYKRNMRRIEALNKILGKDLTKDAHDEG